METGSHTRHECTRSDTHMQQRVTGPGEVGGRGEQPWTRRDGPVGRGLDTQGVGQAGRPQKP